MYVFIRWLKSSISFLAILCTLNFKFLYRFRGVKASSKFLLKRKGCLLYEFFLRLKFVNSLVAPVMIYPKWAPFRALRYIELGLLISAREVGLPSSLTLTDSVKHWRWLSINMEIMYNTGVISIHIVQLLNRLTTSGVIAIKKRLVCSQSLVGLEVHIQYFDCYIWLLKL